MGRLAISVIELVVVWTDIISGIKRTRARKVGTIKGTVSRYTKIDLSVEKRKEVEKNNKGKKERKVLQR